MVRTGVRMHTTSRIGFFIASLRRNRRARRATRHRASSLRRASEYFYHLEAAIFRSTPPAPRFEISVLCPAPPLCVVDFVDSIQPGPGQTGGWLIYALDCSFPPLTPSSACLTQLTFLLLLFTLSCLFFIKPSTLMSAPGQDSHICCTTCQLLILFSCSIFFSSFRPPTTILIPAKRVLPYMRQRPPRPRRLIRNIKNVPGLVLLVHLFVRERDRARAGVREKEGGTPWRIKRRLTRGGRDGRAPCESHKFCCAFTTCVASVMNHKPRRSDLA